MGCRLRSKTESDYPSVYSGAAAAERAARKHFAAVKCLHGCSLCLNNSVIFKIKSAIYTIKHIICHF